MEWHDVVVIALLLAAVAALLVMSYAMHRNRRSWFFVAAGTALASAVAGQVVYSAYKLPACWESPDPFATEAYRKVVAGSPPLVCTDDPVPVCHGKRCGDTARCVEMVPCQ